MLKQIKKFNKGRLLKPSQAQPPTCKFKKFVAGCQLMEQILILIFVLLSNTLRKKLH